MAALRVGTVALRRDTVLRVGTAVLLRDTSRTTTAVPRPRDSTTSTTTVARRISGDRTLASLRRTCFVGAVNVVYQQNKMYNSAHERNSVNSA
jgi:hypothetical protein